MGPAPVRKRGIKAWKESPTIQLLDRLQLVNWHENREEKWNTADDIE